MKASMIIVSIATWLMVPTGTPDDVITFSLIARLGIKLYIILLIAFLFFLWYHDISFKKIRSALKSLVSK